MKQWFIKTFQKSKAIRAIIHYPDKRVRTFWAIPKEDLITIDGRTYRCNTEIDYYNIWEGIPTFTYAVDKIEPIRLDNQKASLMTTNEFNVALNNKIVRDIFSSTDKKLDPVTITLIALFVMIGLVGFAIWKFNEQLDIIKKMIENIYNYLGIGG